MPVQKIAAVHLQNFGTYRSGGSSTTSFSTRTSTTVSRSTRVRQRLRYSTRVRYTVSPRCRSLTNTLSCRQMVSRLALFWVQCKVSLLFPKAASCKSSNGQSVRYNFSPGHSGISGIPAFSTYGLVLGDFPPSQSPSTVQLSRLSPRANPRRAMFLIYFVLLSKCGAAAFHQSKTKTSP